MKSTDFISPREAYDQITLGLLDGNLQFANSLRKKNDLNSVVYAINNLCKDGKIPFNLTVDDLSAAPWRREGDLKFVVTAKIGEAKFVHEVNTITEVRAMVIGMLGICFASVAQKANA